MNKKGSIRELALREAAQCCLDLYKKWRKHNSEHLDLWEKKPLLTGKDYFKAIKSVAKKGKP